MNKYQPVQVINAEWFRRNMDRWQTKYPDGYELCLPVLIQMGFSTGFEYGNDESPSIGLNLYDQEAISREGRYLQVFYGVDVTHYHDPNCERHSLQDYGYMIYDSESDEWEQWDTGVEVLTRIIELLESHSQAVHVWKEKVQR